jgi:hypothetical protein
VYTLYVTGLGLLLGHGRVTMGRWDMGGAFGVWILAWCNLTR